MNWIIIPARQGSKGLPYKNRQLFKFTADTIPSRIREKVIVSTDDHTIRAMSLEKGFKVCWRSSKLGTDKANIKDVLLEVVKPMLSTDIITMLYLTYPLRTWDQIVSAELYFAANGLRSLLCKEEQTESEIHPYRWFYPIKGEKGKQIVKHDLYRRQDYPKMFKASHAIFIARVSEIKKLNKNLWNKNTVFFPIDNMLDIDNEADFKKIKGANK
jgi:CMP-N-acetylneuraminic acid synthetase